ncbi:ABC transporter substrate-binding protein [Paenibacillus thalictri]|uniref:Extracellular solute-binding protein n=1 Tax=Paenibacillus thalictri TaxID=2527873 RepID=A0A4Q9DJI0_9BACL|nr:extracellular solute-binding protein [Paenibacillus thalictri]TBL71593.1 extracellular solute-binding protein [Paenibacillus thalictri]
MKKTLTIALALSLTAAAGCSPSGETGKPAGSQAGSAPSAQTSTASGPSKDKKVTLRFATNWTGTSPMTQIVKDTLDQFRKDYPNVTIEVEETPGNDHITKIKLDAVSDRIPDMFNYWRLDPGFGLDEIARAGKVADLSDWVKSDPFFKELFDESAWKTATLDGKTYGIPGTMFYTAIYANKEVFDNAGIAIPSTWDEWMSAVKGLKAKGVLPFGISVKGDSQGVRTFDYVFSNVLGNDRMRDIILGKEPFNNPDTQKAAQMLQDLLVGNVPEDAIAIAGDVAVSKYLNTGKAAMFIDNSSSMSSIKPEVQDKLVQIKFPLIPGGAQKTQNYEKDLTQLFYLGSKGWSDKDKRPFLEELVKRFASREQAKIYAEKGQQTVPQLGANIDPQKFGRLATEGLKLAQSAPGNKWLPSYMTPDQRAKFEPLISSFLAGEIKADKFVQEMDKIFNPKAAK